MIKRIVIMFLGLIVMYVNVYAISELDFRDKFIHDNACVINKELNNFIKVSSDNMELNDKVKFVLDTVVIKDNENLKEYTNKMYSKYYMENNSIDCGVLLIIDTSSQNISIKTGKKLEGVFTKDLEGELEKNFKELYEFNNDLNKCIKHLYIMVYNKITDSYESTYSLNIENGEIEQHHDFKIDYILNDVFSILKFVLFYIFVLKILKYLEIK